MTDTPHLATWNAYQAAWSDISDQERRDLLAGSVAEACRYTDPQTDLRGLDALIAKIERAQKDTPGASFRNDQLTERGDEALSEWTMYGADAVPRVKGASYARFGNDGRLTDMSGFFTLADPKSAREPSVRARTWDIYQAAWARLSQDQRRSLLAASVSEAAAYTDPAGRKDGRDALGAYIEGVQEKTPGVWFRQTLFLEHHDQALSRWERLSPDGSAPIAGASYARFGADGQLIQMSGFPGSKPSA